MIGTQRKLVFWSVFLCVSLFFLWAKTTRGLDADMDTDMLLGVLGGMLMGWIFGVYGDEYAYSWKITDMDGRTVHSPIRYNSRQAALDSAIVASWGMSQPMSLEIIEH